MKNYISIAAVDYGILSPAISTFVGEVSAFSFENCVCSFLTDRAKFIGKFGKNVTGFQMKDWTQFEDRFDQISEWALSQLPKDCELVGIEGYSFGSKGKVFHIAENTGLLKYKMWKQNLKFQIVSPNEIKKFATQKGNATKTLLEKVFVAKTGVNLRALLNQTEKQFNPSSDIIDSFFLLDFIRNNAFNLS